MDGGVLSSFAKVIEEQNTPAEHTRFLFPFSQDTVGILETFAKAELSFAEAAEPFQMKPLWHESGSTKKDGILKYRVDFPVDPGEAVLTGSLLYVGNPLYKCPSPSGKAEIEVNLDLIPDQYLTRNYYARIIDQTRYRSGLTSLKWEPDAKHTDKFRIAFRRMMSPPTERTLIAALIPPQVAHVDTVESLAFASDELLLRSYPLWVSLPFDFLVKVTGLSDFRESGLRFFPWTDVSEVAIERALRLACLTEPYASLWNSHRARLTGVSWSSSDPRLGVEDTFEVAKHNNWSRSSPLRSDFARRQALVEIDVLVAKALGLTLEQLIEMYRTQFHVLNENERGTWYDINGQIIWTCSKGLTGVGYRKRDGKKPTAKEWVETYANLPEGSILECEVDVDFLPSGPQTIKRSYVAPFTTCDREADYLRAWAFFEADAQRKAA